MVIDVCTYNGEKELFDLRYNVLKDIAGEFRVIEFDKTFSGKPKEPTFDAGKYENVKHYFITEDVYNKYEALALSSPNTDYGRGAYHWVTEFKQKESIKDALSDLSDSTIVYIGDVDEIWQPTPFVKPLKLKLRVYTYYLDNRSTEEFWGTIVAYYSQIKRECLNHIRVNAEKTDYYCGWHFTSMGGYEEVRKKLTDSYTDDSYANPETMGRLEESIRDRRDFLGRGFNYALDRSEWPKYLSENKDKYKQLCLNTNTK